MRTSRFAKAVNWRYAIGEAVLIVIGITIALAFDSWWEYRKEREDESKILLQFQKTLGGDIERSGASIERFEEMEQGIKRLMGRLEQGVPYPSDMDSLFAFCRGWTRFTPNRGPYEALKSKGFDLVSNEALRMNLIDYYENQHSSLVVTSEETRIHNRDVVMPYFERNFVRNDRGRSRPIDFDAVVTDQYFINICATKHENIADWALPRLRVASSIAETLLTDITSELQTVP